MDGLISEGVEIPASRELVPQKTTYWIEDLTGKSKQHIHQDELPPKELNLKRMLDSYMEQLLPFKSEPELLEQYIDPYGGIRIGKVFEDVDLLAANVAYKHCDSLDDVDSLTIVTASIDRLDLIKPLTVCDLRLSGHVSYVGYSSMEVLIKIEALHKTGDNGVQAEKLMTARFVMVVRDPFTGRPVQVNPLRFENEYQKKLFQIAEEQKVRKSAYAAMALTKLPPTEEEKLLIHDLYLEYSKYTKKKERLPEDIVWMDETIMESYASMQPQNRNNHGYVFGGYLLRIAYEIAVSNASVFLKGRASFLSLDEVIFRKPVPVGSVVGMKSQIVYAPGSPNRTIQLAVTADVLDIKRDRRFTTNTFYFTFSCDNPDMKVRRVMPKTYNESMSYVEGKRRHETGMKLRNIYTAPSTTPKVSAKL